MTDTRETRSGFSGFLSYFYGNFIVLLLGFIQTPLVTRLMSTDEYGRTGMFETAVSCIYIFAILGLDQTYIRYYYKAGTDRRRLMGQCLLPPFILVAVLVVIYFFFSAPANNWLFGRNSVDITLLVAGYTVVSVFERFLFLDVRMQQNGRLYSNINIAQKVINILLIFIFFRLFHNDFRVVLYAMTLSWLSTTLFLAVRFLFFTKEKVNEPEYDIVKKRDYPERELISYGLPFILVLLMEWLLSSCDRIALKSLADFNELGIYSAAMKIMVLLLTFKNTFLAYWSPVAMERYEKGDGSEKEFFREAFDIVRFLCMAAAIGMISMRNVIVLILGKDYRGADRIIPFLTLMPIFAIMFEITVQGIKFKKKNIFLNIASLAAIVVNICGNYMLVPIYGGVGAALTTGISYLIYFIVGSLLSERFYPVGYDNLRTGMEAVMVFALAGMAAFGMPRLITSLYGLIIIFVILLMEKKSLVRIISLIPWKKKA